MYFLLQVCKEARVRVDFKVVSEIKKGIVNLVGFAVDDDEKTVDKMVDKLLKARIFKDDKGLTNLSIKDVDGEILSVSQFTLYASLKGGNRPSFTKAMSRDKSEILYQYFVNRISSLYSRCSFGIFHADMEVELTNDGPFTIIMDSKELF
ncbi:MAG: D-aminoacyl-tRNA deacylase [Candidatus Enterosoma sp.]|nr:D-aminoacyl-tRNA deacylase [Bacilli bacterium]MDD7607934.1 D-aminoacyl-tRNA deacylase [bacterium]MDY3907770.1 D-aminoacyl-tRNA deacylase [Candidatus Enterosoma sp.]MDY5650351.1 D-aminoacyl-tRNA deacylase [Candidatus Enterosoma sp.]MDY5866004.1 D-aminoacyl-tRNA deacylase [Candidatus Enterosoma sp.]